MYNQPENIKTLLFDLLSPNILNTTYLDFLQKSFKTDYYVYVSHFFNTKVFEILKAEVLNLEKYSKMKNFIMLGYDTPRIMKVLGGMTILKHSSVLPLLYKHSQLISLLKKIVGKKIYDCLHPQEFMAIHYQQGKGATHGWHYDDADLTLVIVLEAPDEEYGGNLQFIGNEIKKDDGNIKNIVDLAERQNKIRIKHHKKGDCYLLNSGQCLHRVTPINTDSAKRVITIMAYEYSNISSYGITASLLYNG